MLKFKDLHIGFQGVKKRKELFSSKEFEFEKGQLIALIGKNGAGKTTFFDHLMGFLPPLKGNFYWNNQNLQAISKKEKAKIMSYVPSKFYGVNHLSVYELIAMGRAPYTNLLDRLGEEDKKIIEDVITTLHLEELKDKNTVFLSDGERQIAMIGKALAQNTDIIILDEPTAFLDYNNKKKIIEILKDIALQHQKIIFISSHDLDLCFDFCTQIMAIDSLEKQLLFYSFPFQKEAIIQEVFEK